jgi:hypothetical protein
VRGVFFDSFALGRPLAPDLPGLHRYAELALDWYFGPGAADSAVVEAESGTVVGYVLVCTDQAGFERWQRRAAARYLAAGALVGLAPWAPAASRRFHRLRIRDGWDLLRRSPGVPVRAHAHFNLAGSARAGLVIRDMVAHIDRRCAAAGIDEWLGEMNARAGTRVRVIERYGNRIVHRAHNHTLSWLAGEPIERLTVLRPVGAIARVDAPHDAAPMVAAPDLHPPAG